MRFLFFSIIFSLAFFIQTPAQNSKLVKGLLLDSKTQEALPYSNIVVLHKYFGTVSNESGYFSLDTTSLSMDDSVSFQYIGYKTKVLLLNKLIEQDTIYLTEELISLSEAFVFGNPLDPKTIIKRVIENKDKNYPKRATKAQTFIRWRNISDIEKATLNVKKNSIKELDEASLQNAADKLPRHNTSYTDFLGDLYFSSAKDDSLKIAPTRTVSLEREKIDELSQMAEIFENLFKKSDEEEYWKVKSGILSQKLTIEDPVDEDSTSNNDDNTVRTKYYSSSIENKMAYSLLNDKDQWEFLYKTGKYNYSLIGGTKVNGEDVYIIDFSPKGSGLFEGRAYVSMSTYALIRADYEYAAGKTGRDFHMFGVGYSMNYFSGSIYFEKKDNNYCLKYFSLKSGQDFSVDRKVSLVKKRKRFFWDKTLKEIKVGLVFQVSSVESIEMLLLSNQEIKQQDYTQFKQKDKMEIIYTDHFSDNLWKGYPSIEPTKRMREYVKP